MKPDPMPWRQLLLISTAALVSFGALLNFAPLLPLVRDEFGISNAWAGLLASSTILSHTLMQLPGGQLTDSLRAKRAMVLGVTLIGLAVLGAGLSPDMATLLLCRFVLGAGTSTSFIAGLALINATIPGERRAFAQGFFGGAGNIGVLLVMLASERLAVVGGWRFAFALEGLAVLGVALLLQLKLSEYIAPAKMSQPSWQEIFAKRPLYLLGLAHILTYGVFMSLATWMSTFLWQEHGVELAWAGPLSAFLVAAAAVGRILGGGFARGRERPTILLSCFGTALLTVLLPQLPSLTFALLVLLLLGWCASAPFGAIFSYMSLISAAGASGRDFSLINFVANLGALFFPPLVGYALDVTGSFTLGFALVGGAGLVGALFVSWLLPHRSTNAPTRQSPPAVDHLAH